MIGKFKILGMFLLLSVQGVKGTGDFEHLKDTTPKTSPGWFLGKNFKNLASTFVKFYLVVNQSGTMAYDKGASVPATVATPTPVLDRAPLAYNGDFIDPTDTWNYMLGKNHTNTCHAHEAPSDQPIDMQDFYRKSQEQNLMMEDILGCLDHLSKAWVNPPKADCMQWFGDFVSNGIYFSPQKMQEFYRNVYANSIGGGRFDICLIWDEVLNLQDFKNPHTGIYEEVTVVKHFTDPFRYSLGSVSTVVDNYRKLKVLKEMGISHYIPEHKFVHLGPQYFRRYQKDWSWKDLLQLYVGCRVQWWAEHTNLYTVVEKIDTTYKSEISWEDYMDIYWGLIKNVTKRPFPVRVVVEHNIGQWAAQHVANVELCTTQEWYYGLKWDENYLAYHIGNQTYLFEPGYSPRYLALVHAKPLKSKKLQCSSWDRMAKLNEVQAFTPEVELFQRDLGSKGLFGSMAKHLKMYKVSEQRVIPSSGVTHLYIPEALIN